MDDVSREGFSLPDGGECISTEMLGWLLESAAVDSFDCVSVRSVVEANFGMDAALRFDSDLFETLQNHDVPPDHKRAQDILVSRARSGDETALSAVRSRLEGWLMHDSGTSSLTEWDEKDDEDIAARLLELRQQ